MKAAATSRVFLPIRSRWTWRRLLCTSFVVFTIYCWLSGMHLFSAALPPYTGPYGVGAIDLEIPVPERVIGKTTVKKTGKPVFKLETVLFTLYYPTAKSARTAHKKHLWIPKPISLHGEGYARFAHVSNPVTNNVFTFALWLLAGSNEIPAVVDAPLASSAPQLSDASSGSTLGADAAFPVVVFSHGMASSRTASSQYCGELASQGYVVAALEHRDGSGPGSMMIRPDGSKSPVFHQTMDKLKAEPELDHETFKEEQLDFREAEILETIKILQRINAGAGEKVAQQNTRKEGMELHAWSGRLETDQVIVGGHSFGATAALRVLKGAPSANLPIKAGIILDPGKHSGPLNNDVAVPLIVVHSTSWSKQHSIFFGRPHFDVVRDIVEGVNARGKAGWFMTALGTSHPSPTDAPLIEPLLLSWTTGCTLDVHGALMQYARVSEEFLAYLQTGEKGHILAEPAMSESYTHGAWTNSPDRHVRDEITKWWQIHVAPSS